MYSVLVTMGAGIISPVPNVSSNYLSVKMSLAMIIALAEPCLPGLAVLNAVTLQGNYSFIMSTFPGCMRPASSRVMFSPEEIPLMNSLSDIVNLLLFTFSN